MSTTQEAVTALLARYNDALNASSTDAVMPLYAEDGVFMPPYSPPQLAQGRSGEPTMRSSGPLP
jgi:ketosteroid isomerase-like protein